MTRNMRLILSEASGDQPRNPRSAPAAPGSTPGTGKPHNKAEVRVSRSMPSRLVLRAILFLARFSLARRGGHRAALYVFHSGNVGGGVAALYAQPCGRTGKAIRF